MKNRVLKRTVCYILAFIIMIVSGIRAFAENSSIYKLNIIEQPQDSYVDIGSTAEFSVRAEGDGITYRWYYSKDNGETWNTCQYGSSYRTAALDFTTVSYQYGYKFRCLVKDKYGNSITSEEAELKRQELTITEQPSDVYCTVGAAASFSVNASGTNVTYRWYYSKDNGETWNTCQYGSNYKTAALDFTTVSYQYGYKFRCLVKDKYGNGIISEEASLLKPRPIINTYIDDVYCDIGETAEFKVYASGNLAYRWYYSKDNGETWNTCQYGSSYKTDTLSFETKEYQYGYLFRCNVTDSDGNVTITDSAGLSPKPLNITVQPVSVSAAEGETTVLHAEAEGYKPTYTWYYSKDGGETWALSPFAGRKTASMTISAVMKYSGWRFYCEVTDKSGNTVSSDAVTLSVTETPVPAVYLTNENNFESIITEEREPIVSSEDFINNAVQSENGELSVRIPVDETLEADDVLMLRFTAYATEQYGKLQVSIGNTDYVGNFVLQTEKTDYFLPVSGYEEIDDIMITLATEPQSFTIGNFELVNCGKANVTELKTGMYNLSGTAKNTVYDVEDKFGSPAMDVVTDGDYLYSVYNGTLSIYSLEDKEAPILINSMTGLGNSRDIAFCNDGKALAVSARENGVYLVSVEDINNPYIIKNIDTLGLATGIDTEGDYLFICSRNFGVEIYDISDLSSPEYCSQVSDEEEYYDCCVSNGYLYVASWAQRNMHIYDLSDIYEPIPVSEFLLGGVAAGCTVKDGILYAATSYHSTDTRATVTSPGYGMGSGLDIIDVHDPENPVWLATSKNDGRYFYSGFDHWRVTVSGNYAYMTDSYAGAYIIDISNPKNPKRVDKISVYIPQSSSYYKKINQGTYIFPYDTVDHSEAIMSDAAVADGYVYFGSYTSGIYKYQFDNAVYSPDVNQELSGTARRYTSTNVDIPGYTVNQYSLDGSVYAVAAKDDYYFCATGSAGIQVLDKEMNVVNKISTPDAVKDVKIYGEYLYAAETNSGLGIYRINGCELERISGCTYNYYNTTISQLAVFPDGRHIGAQAGFTRFLLIDISDPYSPRVEKAVTTGTMYYRNMCTGLVSGKYVGEFDRSYIWWYQTDENGNAAEFKKLTNSINAETNGTCAYGDYAFAIYSNGYVYYNPETAVQSDISSLVTHKVNGAKFLKGKTAMFGNIAVASYGYGKQLTLIDVTDLENPVLIAQFYTEGNPDVAYCECDTILVPLRYSGILKISRNK